MGLLRVVKYFQTLTAGAVASTSIVNPSTALAINMAGATGVQTIALPTANMYSGEVCSVSVVGGVATQTVVVKTGGASGTTIDTFAAKDNGARLYVYNGVTNAWQLLSGFNTASP